MAREIFDIQQGARSGSNSNVQLMKIVVANLRPDDIIAITAYLASLPISEASRAAIQRYYHPRQGFSDRTMQGMVAELTDMAEAVRQGRQPEPGGEAGRTSVALVQAVYQAAGRGAWVELGM